MLPDLWRMAARRARARPGLAPGVDPVDEELGAVLDGVQHHLRADAWFHASPLFLDGLARCRSAFRDAAVGGRRMRFLAHVAWELCLDGALVRRIGLAPLLEELRRDLAAHTAAARRAAHLHVAGRLEGEALVGFERRMDELAGALADGDWIAGYAHGDGVARRLDGVRRRVGLPPATDQDRPAIAGALDAVLDAAEAELERALDARLAIPSG